MKNGSGNDSGNGNGCDNGNGNNDVITTVNGGNDNGNAYHNLTILQ